MGVPLPLTPPPWFPWDVWAGRLAGGSDAESLPSESLPAHLPAHGQDNEAYLKNSKLKVDVERLILDVNGDEMYKWVFAREPASAAGEILLAPLVQPAAPGVALPLPLAAPLQAPSLPKRWLKKHHTI